MVSQHLPSLAMDFHLLPSGHTITSVETGAVQTAYWCCFFFLVLNTSFQPDRWTDLTHPLAQETCWDGVTRNGKDRFHIFCCSNDFPVLCWEQVSTFQLAPGLRNTHSLFHPADQHPLLSQAHVIITYYYNTSVMTACRTLGSPCTFSARQTRCEEQKKPARAYKLTEFL